ncbi:hypothetical protein QTP70_011450 [Hemibagrus guttatus]|uniref:Uncharacterized protein n=1 Tax=Hemibagrus guttatus TaxID=175788 RepID=A0AAE0RDP0_9TELE|nr:hypothetical protein QTP70_011450 [Hemibagrus guttatus]
MLYGLETVSLRKRQESELEVAELKMLRFSMGMTRLDRIRNEYIRGTAHVGRLGDKVREARLRWFGHVQRREKKCWSCFRVTIGFLVTSIGFFHLRMMKATALIGTFNATDIFLYPSPDLCLETILSQRSTDNFLDFMA